MWKEKLQAFAGAENYLIFFDLYHKFQGMKWGKFSINDFYQKGHFAGQFQGAKWKECISKFFWRPKIE